MKIRGSRVVIDRLRLEDVYKMRDWGFHKNILLEDYNFPTMGNLEIRFWYKRKTGSRSNKYYSIKNEEGQLIGYMGIKDIKKFRKRSTLGIVFDPNYINKGYGTETLKVFLRHYFTEMKMRSMLLEVAEFNKRAYRVYEKIGFKPMGYYLDEFFDHNLDLSNPYYLEEKLSFVIKDKKVYNYIYMMELKKKNFMKLNQ